jgi:hypothetical protein
MVQKYLIWKKSICNNSIQLNVVNLNVAVFFKEDLRSRVLRVPVIL